MPITPEMIKTIIVDDEPNAREVLNRVLTEFCPEISVVAQANSVDSAYAAIQQQQPQLVFLDIEMQGETGFELIERFDNPTFKIIFVTAYDHYALKAIKFSALDYVLKPISETDLVNAVQKAKQQLGIENRLDNLQNLLINLRNPNDKSNKIVVNTQTSSELIEVQNIIRCEASGSYTTLHLRNQRPILSSKNLKTYQDLLETYNFFRVHDSHLINYSYINKVLNEEGGLVLTSTNDRIPISRRRKTEFQDWLLALNWWF